MRSLQFSTYPQQSTTFACVRGQCSSHPSTVLSARGPLWINTPVIHCPFGLLSGAQVIQGALSTYPRVIHKIVDNVRVGGNGK